MHICLTQCFTLADNCCSAVIRMVRYIQINLRQLLPSCIPVILTVQTDAVTTHDKQPSDWKLNNPLGFNLQQRGHCLSVGICFTVSCTQINLASKHYTPFCHDGMLHQSVLKKFGCITDIQGFTSILFTRDVNRSPNVRTSDPVPKFGSKF